MKVFVRRMPKTKVFGGLFVLIGGFYIVWCVSSSSTGHRQKYNYGGQQRDSYLQRRIQSAKDRPSAADSRYERQRAFEDNVVQKVTSLSSAVILITYMRSGSSMTGDILQRHPDVFYVFEPLHPIEMAGMDSDDIIFLNGTVLKHGKYNKTEVYMTDLIGWLTCDLNKVTIQSICSVFMRFGRKTEDTYKCLLGRSEYKLLCISDLVKQCKASKTKVVKVLRISMETALGVMEMIPGSKVIHLVRDPRATLYSKKLVDPVCKGEVVSSNCSKSHCDSVNENTAVLNSFPPAFRERIITIRYEDIIDDPISKAKWLYTFIGMEFTDEIRRYVYNITLGGNVGECKVCSMRWQFNRRPNSTLSSHVAHWKSKLTFSEVWDIQGYCGDAIGYYGYKLYDLDD